MSKKSPAEIVECSGGAHSGDYDQDHCMICMPYWGNYPVCPEDGTKLPHSGFCKECRKYYSIDRKALE